MDASTEGTPERLKIWKLRRSRDAWKAKCRKRRQQIQALQTNLRDLERSRNAWREHCLALDGGAAPPSSPPVPPCEKKLAPPVR